MAEAGVNTLDLEIYQLVSLAKFASVREVLSWPKSFRRKMLAIFRYQKTLEEKEMGKAKTQAHTAQAGRRRR